MQAPKRRLLKRISVLEIPVFQLLEQDDALEYGGGICSVPYKYLDSHSSSKRIWLELHGTSIFYFNCKQSQNRNHNVYRNEAKKTLTSLSHSDILPLDCASSCVWLKRCKAVKGFAFSIRRSSPNAMKHVRC